MIWNYLVPPLVGAVIGYITNDIALRMLFRPHEAKHIFGIHIPFTPGIIPKEKPRIAEAIGKAVSVNLMNQEVLEKTLLSDEMVNKIAEAIDHFVAEQSTNEQTLREFALHYLTEEDIAAMQSNVSDGITKLIGAKLQDARIGEDIAHMATTHIIEKTQTGVAGRLGADRLVTLLATPVEKLLSKHINEILSNNAPEMVASLVSDQSEKLMEMPMKELVSDREDQVEQIKRGVVGAYRNIISERLPRMLQALDIHKIVTERINEMDMDEAEEIIFSVIHKELKAIVWLGALLGCVMGTFNLLLDL